MTFALDVTTDGGAPVGIAAAAADADTVAAVVVVAGQTLQRDGGTAAVTLTAEPSASPSSPTARRSLWSTLVVVTMAEQVAVSVTKDVSDKGGIVDGSSATDRAAVTVAVGDAVGDVEWHTL